jgi:RNA 2',3'-cyclic 3'-phosphodiesterase
MLSSIINDLNSNRIFDSLENKRLFIAVEIPAIARKAIYQQGLKVLKNFNDSRLVKVNNMHITLKFLGSIPLSKICLISDSIAGAAAFFNNFSFVINGKIDAFPNKKKARTVYSGIEEGKLEFKMLYLSLEESLRRTCMRFRVAGGPNDFVAHVTVARFRQRTDISNAIDEAGMILPIRIDCKSITLFESILDPEGARYIKLKEFSLK